MSSTPAPQPAAPADQNAAACADKLRERFPALFSGGAKPLKLKIQADIQQRAPGEFTKQALSAFFRRYTGSTSYLIALTRAPHRFDLDGQPAGEVSEEHRQAATEELARRRANQQARRAVEDEQRHNRAQLLRDHERTTLTRANFCALKGIAEDELDALLALAREEAAAAPPRREAPHRAGPRPGAERRDRPDRPRGGRPPPPRDRSA